MKVTAFGWGLALCLGLCAGGAWAEDGKAKKDEKPVPLDQVPANIKAAAEGAVKGFEMSKVVKETKGDVILWDVEGKADGKKYAINVSNEGKVLQVEEDKKAGGKGGAKKGEKAEKAEKAEKDDTGQEGFEKEGGF